MPTLIIHTPTLNDAQHTLFQSVGELKACNNHFRIECNHIDNEKLFELRHESELDLNLLPDGFDGKDVKLLISDMDSTLIAIECIDEIADYMNIKPQVSEITEAAMRGELDFEGSLTKRVGLLKGLNTTTLQQVYDERLQLNPGANTLIDSLKAKSIKFALVSGGFTFFTDRLKDKLGLDFTRANVLSETDGKLNGSVDGAIIGAQAKADFLHELCQKLNIQPHQVIAAGDGANDLLMMKEAGLSVAYHAKPAVQSQASTALNHRGLDAILDFLAE
ncbi:phosphoserine phosphatase SerB [Thiomicrorhabdus indica]|uniref:phosphoserine phosphatase SerB n=1 Tax=Thiomicrorhabdus indica TaxID=2267253 RepID=UPI00102DD46C|nr:phosphoserine phosphatase SerB [Thiomicrorhabdus indica]